MRRLVVFGSVSGAPGVTTTALAVAAAWPSDADGGVRPVVVEADPSGGDLMIRFGLPASPSLLDVAAAARQPHPGSLLGAVSELPCGVRVVAGAPGRAPSREAIRLLTGEAGRNVLLGDGRDRGTVLLDVGRFSAEVGPLLVSADQVVTVARGGAESLTHVSTYDLHTDAHVESPTLAVVGPCPYRAREITEALDVRRAVFLPWDARSVAAMNKPKRSADRAVGSRRRSLLSAARDLACWPAGLDEEQQVGRPALLAAGRRHGRVDNETRDDGTRQQGQHRAASTAHVSEVSEGDHE